MAIGSDMDDRDKWLKALQEFGRGADVAADYALHIDDTRLLREVLLFCGRGRRNLFLSNDNDSNYSASLLRFPPEDFIR